MDFGFTPEQDSIRDLAARFAAERLAPLYQARDSEDRIDRDLLRAMGGLGLIGADLPEEFGGGGQDGVTGGVIIEEIARGDFNVSYVQLLDSLMGHMVAGHAAAEVARDVIGSLCAGETLIALGLTEPGGGSDAAHLSLRARREGEAYVLNGEKTSISLAAQADLMVLAARTGGEGARGVSAFLVPMDLDGIVRTRFNDVGSSVVGRGSVFFDDVRVSEGARIGPEGAGFRTVMQGFDYSRALIGLMCLGAASASLAETWEYVKERKAFGMPIAKYQGVTAPLAEAETHIEAARLLCYKTLWLRDHGKPHTAEAAMCKWFAPKVAFDVIHDCIICTGHFAYSKDMPHQQRLRDVMGLQIGDGTPQIQKMIIARERIGRVAVPYA